MLLTIQQHYCAALTTGSEEKRQFVCWFADPYTAVNSSFSGTTVELEMKEICGKCKEMHVDAFNLCNECVKGCKEGAQEQRK